MSSAAALGTFLASRRSRVDPRTSGFGVDARRKVVGLRREEVAILAHVSVDYYTQLEQGRAPSPSMTVLDSLADALRLGEDERDHLLTLARPARPASETADGDLRPGLVSMLDAMRHQGALIVDHRMDVLGANRIADALTGGWFSDGRHDGNLARYVFGDPAARHAHPDWEDVAASLVSTLRFDAARRADDPQLSALLEDLHELDGFADLWERHDVTANTHGTKCFLFGEHTVTVDYEVTLLRGLDEARLTIYTPRPDDGATAALASIAARPGPWVVLRTPPLTSTF